MDDRGGRRIQDEVEHHLRELARQLEREGLSPSEARVEARRRFGDPDRVARTTRAAAGTAPTGLAGGIRGDVVQALRGLRRSPAAAASVVVTLALSLGATVAAFSVVWEVLLRPLDLREPASLVALVESQPETGTDAMPVSDGTFQDWRRDLRTISSAVGYEWVTRTLQDEESPEELLGVQASGDFFEVLGIPAALGRVFTAGEERSGAAGPVLLSHDFWLRRFGGDPGIVGRTLPLEGARREVIGVLPKRLDLFPRQPDVFVPGAHEPADPTNRGSRILNVVARLAPGASVADADSEVRAMARHIAETYPTSARGWSARAVPLREHLLGDARRPLWVALAGAALLLLVGSVNVTNLLLVRASDTAGEMAVRAALGAGRGRLLRLGLVEAGLLGTLGGSGSLLVAAGLRTWLAAAEPGVLPRMLESGLPLAFVASGVVVAACVAVGTGLLPSLRASRVALGTLGRGKGVGTSRAATRGRNTLLVLQLALTVVLLVGAGLLVRTVSALRSVDVGYRPEGLVAARIYLDTRRYRSAQEIRTYFDRLLERVRAVPGVDVAGLTSALPMDPVAANFDLPTRSDEMEGRSWGEVPQADFRIVGPGLMEALGFRVLQGRTLTEADRPDAPLVALVNRSLAALFWPGQDAVGRRIESVWRQGSWFEVVGVVEDTRFYGPDQSSRPELFVPLAQMTYSSMTVVARTSGDVGTAQRAVEEAVIDTDPMLPPQEVFQVETLVDATTASERFYATLLTGFAVMALTLAAAGVYGVLAYAVRLRTRELGVRLALGAGRDEVVGMVVREAVLLAAAGTLVGIAAAIPATRIVAGMLFGVEPTDPLTLAAVAFALSLVAGAACVQPAFRASRLDPARVLREE